MSMDNLPAPSVATQVRQANSDTRGNVSCAAQSPTGSATRSSTAGPAWRPTGRPVCPCRAGDIRCRLRHPGVLGLVVKDMADRAAMGIRKYGQALRPHNGRDSLLDAYHEALDLAQYLRQALYERDGR